MDIVLKTDIFRSPQNKDTHTSETQEKWILHYTTFLASRGTVASLLFSQRRRRCRQHAINQIIKFINWDLVV